MCRKHRTGRKFEGICNNNACFGIIGDTERERNIEASNFASFCIKSDLKGYISYLLDNILNSWKGAYSIRNNGSYVSHGKALDMIQSVVGDFAGYIYILEWGLG